MSAASARDPERVGPYRLLHTIGEGGMGVVHLGLDDDGRAVAVKMLKPHIAADPDARRRLAREVATLRRVRHPRVAAVIDADVEGDRPYLITTFVPGKPLDAHVKEHGPLPRGHVARVGSVLADALKAIHAVGIVHRDVKPANVMLLDGEPVLIDFGIAHLADESRITQTGLVMGTPGYLSPEVIGGDAVTEATDWWGWGATLAYAATGRPPFGTGPIEVVLDRVRRGATDLHGIDPGLASTLSAALAIESSARPDPAVLVAGLAAAPGRAGPAPERIEPERIDLTTSAKAQVLTLPDPTVQVAPPLATRRLDAAGPEPMRWAPPPNYQPPPAPPAQPPPAPQPDQGGQPSRDDQERDPAVGVLLGFGVALAAIAAVAPYGAVWTAGLLMLLARTVDRSRTGLLRRRDLRGPRGSDRLLAVLGSPWHALTAAVATCFALILPLLVGISVAFIVASAQAGGASAARPSSPLSLASGMAALLLTSWWGPGGASLRHGARAGVRLLAGVSSGRIALWCLIGLTLAAALLMIANGAQPDWGQLGGSRLFDQLSMP